MDGAPAADGNEPGDSASVKAGTIEALLSHWSRDRRAKGGWWALAGFSFQSAIYLLHLFEGLQDGAKRPDELAKTELLSDVFAPKDGTYTLIQAKRTLDRPRLAASLREAYEISKLCDDDLLQRIRFKISCIECITPAKPHDFSSEEIGADDADVETWDRFLSCFSKDDAVVEEADPLAHLYDFLWRAGILDPAGFVDHCLGTLIRLFANPSQEAIAQIAWDLSGAFRSARGAALSPPARVGRVLGRSDVEIDLRAADADRGILFDRRPQLKDLQLGRLRKRDGIFSDLVQDFEAWWKATKTTDDDSGIPIFWLEGRSGEGKSVLLLQLAQHMLLDSQPPVLTFLGSPDELPRWIEVQRAIQGDQPSLGWLPAVAIVDDLHFLRNREEWENALRAATDLAPPRVAVLACGPTLERQKFEADFAAFFRIHRFQVPNLSRAEMQAFAAWFADQTGQPVDLAAVDPGNRMLVVWMFELLRGESLGEFARNFRRRLEDLNLLDFARAILAANALDLPAPPRLFESLGDSQRDAFQALCSASQLHFESVERGSEAFAGYRLSHPQIDWQLYMEWSAPPATLAQQWGRDLAKSLIAGARDPDSLFASQLIYGVSNSTKLSEAIAEKLHSDIGTLDQALGELYRKSHSELSADEAMPHLPRWLEILFRGLAANLSPGLVQEAVQLAAHRPQPEKLPPAAAGWLWRLSELDAFKDVSDDLRNAARSIVFEVPNKPGVGSALRVIASKAKDRIAAREFCKSWVRDNPVEPQGQVPLESLVAGWPSDSDIVVSARSWLAGNPTNPQAHRLLAPLVAAQPADDSVARLALKWVEDNPTHLQVYQVLAPLIAARPADDQVVKVALKWLRENPLHLQAYWLLSALVAARPADEQIIGLALKWVEDNPTHLQAYQVFAALVAARPADDQIVGVALQWIEDNPTHLQAYWLLSTLVAARSADAQLVGVALKWVEDNPIHPQAHELIKSLVAARPADDVVVGIALKWVEDNPAHPQAYQALAPLVAARSADDEVVGVALKWVEDNSIHPQAHELIRSLVAARPADDHVVGVALKWVEDNPAHPQAYQALAPLVAARSADDQVVGVALKWVEENPTHAQMHQQLAPLVAARPADDQIVGAALKWVKDNPTHPQAYELIRSLVAARPADDVVVGTARAWLDDNANHRHSYNLLTTLIARSGGAEEWMEKGEAALLKATGGPKRTLLVALLAASKADQHYVERTIDVIKAEPDARNRTFLSKSLGRALANNVQHALIYLAGPSTTEHRRVAAQALSQGLQKYPNRAEEFVAQIHTAPSEYVGLLLAACIRSEMTGDVLSGALRAWLNDHRRAKGYGAVLRTLKAYPERWQALMALGGVSITVQADYWAL